MATTFKAPVIVVGIFLCLPRLGEARNPVLILDSTTSSSTQSTTISSDGNFRDSDWNWNVFVGRARSVTTDTTGVQVTDITTSGGAGVDYDFESGWLVGVDYAYSVTPDEYLSNAGPSLTVGYTFVFEPASETKDFAPKLNLKLVAGTQHYYQKFGDASRLARARPTSGNNVIDQKSLGLLISYQPTTSFAGRIGITSYNYSRDVNEFLTYLDGQDRRTTTEGLSQALSGFSKTDVMLELDFYFRETWELVAAARTSKIAADDTLAKDYRIEVFDQVSDHWRAGAGIETAMNEATATWPATTNNQLLLIVEYDF